MNTNTQANRSRLLAPLALVPAYRRGEGGACWFPAVDMLEDDNEFLFRIDLPQVDPEAIQVTQDDACLLVSGERPELGTEGKRCSRIERPHGHFECRFALPGNASREKIASVLRRGVLELHVSKVSAAAAVEPAPMNTFPLAAC